MKCSTFVTTAAGILCFSSLAMAVEPTGPKSITSAAPNVELMNQTIDPKAKTPTNRTQAQKSQAQKGARPTATVPAAPRP